MSQVNLLPPEIRERVKQRRLAFLIGVAGGIVIAILILIGAAKAISLQQINQQIAVQEGVNAGLSGQVDELKPFQEQADELEKSDKLVSTAMAGEISWSQALRDIQLQIPNDMALNSMAGTLRAQVAAVPGAAAAPGETAIGTITFDGESDGTLRIARWLTKLVEVPGWANSWLSNASESGERSNRYSFNTTVDILPEYETARGQGETK